MSKTQDLIDKIEQKLAAGNTVVAGIITMIGEFVAAGREAKDDPEELQAIFDELEAQQSRLAGALVLDTVAEDETPPTGGEDSSEGSTAADSPAGGEGEDSVSAGDGGDSLDGGDS